MLAPSLAVLAAVLLGCTGCVTFTSPDPAAGTSAAAPSSYLDRLKAAPVATPAQEAPGPDGVAVTAFITEDRNIACAMTFSRAGQAASPWEPSNFDDDALKSAPLVPVVDCQLAGYPAPAAATDDCAGTHLGFLGGTVRLSPDAVAYGNCRAGVTAMEAAYGPKGTPSDILADLPILAPGQGIDASGYRCAPLDDGLACANLSNGVGFHIDRDAFTALP
ncbi:hypothetical protein [Arthrobacter sp. 35W]|uniref:hypothetical protein n=1 Tax=Arthrobacter sp. 35W TaxID=1132441 RepID=UPI0004118A7C|nr:hypothetical protein [Arthrobacter sp. 35W]